MTLLELYYGLKKGEIELESGLCTAIVKHVSFQLNMEFNAVMSEDGICKFHSIGYYYLDYIGAFTSERETFLLLFAAYKGEL